MRCSQRNVSSGRRCGIRVAPWKRTAWVGGAVLGIGWRPGRCLTRSGGGCGSFPGDGGDWVCLRSAPFIPEAAREEDQSGHHHDNDDPGDVPGALETTDRLGFVNDHAGFKADGCAPGEQGLHCGEGGGVGRVRWAEGPKGPGTFSDCVLHPRRRGGWRNRRRHRHGSRARHCGCGGKCVHCRDARRCHDRPFLLATHAHLATSFGPHLVRCDAVRWRLGSRRISMSGGRW